MHFKGSQAGRSHGANQHLTDILHFLIFCKVAPFFSNVLHSTLNFIHLQPLWLISMMVLFLRVRNPDTEVLAVGSSGKRRGGVDIEGCSLGQHFPLVFGLGPKCHPVQETTMPCLRGRTVVREPCHMCPTQPQGDARMDGQSTHRNGMVVGRRDLRLRPELGFPSW
jgi:hypothetical protein